MVLSPRGSGAKGSILRFWKIGQKQASPLPGRPLFASLPEPRGESRLMRLTIIDARGGLRPSAAQGLGRVIDRLLVTSFLPKSDIRLTRSGQLVLINAVFVINRQLPTSRLPGTNPVSRSDSAIWQHCKASESFHLNSRSRPTNLSAAPTKCTFPRNTIAIRRPTDWNSLEPRLRRSQTKMMSRRDRKLQQE